MISARRMRVNKYGISIVTIPWSSFLSKNSRNNVARSRVYTPKEVKEVQDNITRLFSELDREWFDTKTWLGIHVQMATRKSDAINVLETVADGVKKGIGIDDKWFSIDNLDWQLLPTNPEVTIQIWQEADEHERVCPTCLEILPLTRGDFGVSVKGWRGFAGVCRPCASKNVSARRKLLKEKENKKNG